MWILLEGTSHSQGHLYRRGVGLRGNPALLPDPAGIVPSSLPERSLRIRGTAPQHPATAFAPAHSGPRRHSPEFRRRGLERWAVPGVCAALGGLGGSRCTSEGNKRETGQVLRTRSRLDLGASGRSEGFAVLRLAGAGLSSCGGNWAPPRPVPGGPARRLPRPDHRGLAVEERPERETGGGTSE